MDKEIEYTDNDFLNYTKYRTLAPLDEETYKKIHGTTRNDVLSSKVQKAYDNFIHQMHRDFSEIPKENALEIIARTEEYYMSLKNTFVVKDNMNINIGDCITFGRYMQNGRYDEEIEWIVLGKEGKRVLLLSKYGLDCKPYHVRYEPVSWKDSTLREWLNSYFFESAFTEDEQKAMRNDAYGCYDKVFLLSIEEADLYIKNVKNYICFATLYAQKYGATTYGTNGGCRWFLRSIIENAKESVAFVDSKGCINSMGCRVDNDILAIRPAVWIDLSAAEHMIRKL